MFTRHDNLFDEDVVMYKSALAPGPNSPLVESTLRPRVGGVTLSCRF